MSFGMGGKTMLDWKNSLALIMVCASCSTHMQEGNVNANGSNLFHFADISILKEITLYIVSSAYN